MKERLGIGGVSSAVVTENPGTEKRGRFGRQRHDTLREALTDFCTAAEPRKRNQVFVFSMFQMFAVTGAAATPVMWTRTFSLFSKSLLCEGFVIGERKAVELFNMRTTEVS